MHKYKEVEIQRNTITKKYKHKKTKKYKYKDSKTPNSLESGPTMSDPGPNCPT